MTNLNIAAQRLHNQKLAETEFKNPADVVAWFGAVQAQDYLGALWGVGLRTKDAVERDIERAIAERQIVRTWPMRGTLHFVAAADVRWMLKLLTPRVIGSSSLRRLYKQASLDEATFTRSKKIFANSLRGGNTLTRNAMYEVLEAKGISTKGQRGLHILSRLAQDGFICFALREGKQQTFALLDEWIPTAKVLERDEALAELAKRYFTSHGPATLQDFAWWSGLTIGDAKRGIEMAKSHLLQEIIDKKAYWFSSLVDVAETPTGAYLLPAYDEYTVAYKDRSAVLNPLYAKQSGNGIFSPTVVIDGQIAGTWKRALRRDSVEITSSFFGKLNKEEKLSFDLAVIRYEKFLSL